MKIVLFFAILAFGANAFPYNDEVAPALSNVNNRRSIAGRIVGGVEVNANNRKLFKYQVGLLFDGKSWCGGSIISARTIITAAHCTREKNAGNVYLGLTQMQDIWKRSTKGLQVIKITKANWVQHPDYSQNPTVNDLAIINLPEPIQFGENVGPIEVECNDKERHENERVIISGWGRHSDSTEKQTTFLRSAVVNTLTNTVCHKSFIKILPSMICISGENTVGTCKGDSGGPIVSTKNGKLLGATSFGKQGCEQALPRVFTRLSSFAKWIQDNSVDHIKNC